jgi:hypothetical protein
MVPRCPNSTLSRTSTFPWFFTYFQPYRYVINRICVYPSIGNHDTAETEDHDDRAQVEDNFYIRERIAAEEAAGRASFEPGLFYRFRYGSNIEFVCIDTSKEVSSPSVCSNTEASRVHQQCVPGRHDAADMAGSLLPSTDPIRVALV